METESFETTCCVVGGGPAGIMLGFLLARAGVHVTVLEKHKDFFRDFRGDTVHPSSLEVMHELGLLKGLLRIPHQKVKVVQALFGGEPFRIADLTGLDATCPFVALMPQWDFLNFLAGRAKQFSGFDLRMEHEAIGLLHESGRVSGVVVRTPAGIRRVRAALVVACDGRHSAVRRAAGLPIKETGVPIDVLWFRIPRLGGDPIHQVLGNINFGKVLILLDRRDYYQAGLIIPKDSFHGIREEGLPAFRALISRLAPFLENRVDGIEDWDQIKLLSVRINRLPRWHVPGLLCIGDAAHAMSPAFGVGINLAIQDAVAAARILAPALRRGSCGSLSLVRVQCRREFPAYLTQLMQVLAHKGFQYIFRQQGPMHAPLPLRVAVHIPGLQKAIGRVVGIGIRPEHVGSVPPPERKVPLARQLVGLGVGVVVGYRAFTRDPRNLWLTNRLPAEPAQIY